MEFPSELRYTPEHEWIKMEGDVAIIGITSFAQGELGDIVFVDISTVGKALKANDIFGSVEAVKTVSDLYLPVSGTILEVNPALNDKPELVNSEPYAGGWMIKLKPDNVADISSLMTAEQYQAQVGV